MVPWALLFVPFLISSLCFGKFPIYTIPDKLGPWSPIDIHHLSCPNNLVVEDEGCNSLSGFSYMELKVGYISAIKVNGFTCTGVVTEAETYTNFVGYVTTTFKRKHFRPMPDACRSAYNWKMAGDPRYEESLHNPYPDYHWLRTVKTTKESLIIISPSVADLDPYDKSLHSRIFPGGKCTGLTVSSTYCSTNHDYTIWMPEKAGLGTSCDIFTNSKGKRASKGGKTCGFVDERGLYKSLKGACKLKLCGVSGLRLMDGTWVAIQTLDETKWCSPDQLVNLHDFHSDELEHLVVEELVRKREECLDALESIMTTKSVSFRRLSHLRKLVPGFGKAYTIFNKTLMEADAHYKSVRTWSEIIPSKGCLRVGGRCHPHVNGVFFNGIILGPDGHVLIPEMQSSLLQQHVELLESSVIPLMHPLADPSAVFKDGDEAEDFVEVHLPDVHKQISGVDLGLPSWGKYILMIAGALTTLMLFIFLMTCCKRVNRTKSRRQGPREIERKVSFTPQNKKVVSSWESYKSGGETKL
uniref:Glycoprotein n=1 Tax=Rabies virus TaxID=11292 RepID=A0A386PVC0_RABV|nr:glycoprotein [Lyssavirus rabies]QEJ74554.1 glycoprotein [Lyssavirus rabies]